MNLILLGAPGSGKGTQANKISEKYEIRQMSTGDIFREAIKKEDSLSKKVKQIVESGGLVPDEIVAEIVFRELTKELYNKGFILDGFPRTLNQVRLLDEDLTKNAKKINKVLYIKLEAEEVIKRLSGRRICEKCGIGYHLLFKVAKTEGICDVCGGKLYQRKDDEESTIRNRLTFYETHIKDVLCYYENKEILYTIDGSKPIVDVFSDLCRAIEE